MRVCARFACSLLRDGMRQILISLDSPDIHKLEEAGDHDKVKEVGGGACTFTGMRAQLRMCVRVYIVA